MNEIEIAFFIVLCFFIATIIYLIMCVKAIQKSVDAHVDVITRESFQDSLVSIDNKLEKSVSTNKIYSQIISWEQSNHVVIKKENNTRYLYANNKPIAIVICKWNVLSDDFETNGNLYLKFLPNVPLRLRNNLTFVSENPNTMWMLASEGHFVDWGKE